mmetsp:Transcript_165651/g.531757  ORF Transcript_165651/g.531757 Transcript_165651/m.531757 type:complete len:386 (-) Transcript_165651:155-1312(-)
MARHGALQDLHRLLVWEQQRPDAYDDAEAAASHLHAVVQFSSLPLDVGQDDVAKAVVARKLRQLGLLLEQLVHGREQFGRRHTDRVAASDRVSQPPHVPAARGLTDLFDSDGLVLLGLHQRQTPLHVRSIHQADVPGLLHRQPQHVELNGLLEHGGPQRRSRTGALHQVLPQHLCCLLAHGRQDPGPGQHELARAALQGLQPLPRLRQVDLLVQVLLFALLDCGLEKINVVGIQRILQQLDPVLPRLNRPQLLLGLLEQVLRVLQSTLTCLGQGSLQLHQAPGLDRSPELRLHPRLCLGQGLLGLLEDPFPGRVSEVFGADASGPALLDGRTQATDHPSLERSGQRQGGLLLAHQPDEDLFGPRDHHGVHVGSPRDVEGLRKLVR